MIFCEINDRYFTPLTRDYLVVRKFPRFEVQSCGKRSSREPHVRHESKLAALIAQKKALEVAELESSNHVWKRILSGLPAGQLSFLLRAGTDTPLPIPHNIKRWRYRTDSSCPLCGHMRPTVHHILSNCQIALDQGCYTWRHDSTLISLVKGLQDHLEADSTIYTCKPSYHEGK